LRETLKVHFQKRNAPFFYRGHKLKEDIQNLLKLQEIDNQIQIMESSKEKIPHEVEEITNLLAARQAELEHSKNKIAEIEKSKRALETEIKAEEERIKKDKERLSQVKTNEEYHALLREIDNSRREISDRETAILKIMDQIEDAKKASEEVTGGMSNLEKELTAKKEEMTRFLQDVDKNIDAKKSEREQYLAKIKPSLLKRYNMIKGKKEYTDILTKIVNYSCAACNMHIPPQMVNEVRSFKQAHVCPTCERILYWSDPDEKNN
jgi:uncharacterized protein